MSVLRLSREVFMKKLAFVALLGLAAAACTTTEERVGGAAVGAGVGAVAGPPGAIVGGAVGAVTGPTVAKTTRRAARKM
jgi:osmotically inducible lipoprotein OsmB